MGQRVPAMLYELVMLVTAVLNIRLVRIATSAPVVGEDIDPLTIARTRARGWGVAAGAALATAFALFVPRLSQLALITIPLWQRLAMRRAEKRMGA